MSRYSKDDVARATAEMQLATYQIKAALQGGLAPDSSQAMDGAEAHLLSISKWWYECTYEIHKGLADMYVNDVRFTDFYEKQLPGLAKFMHDAIYANTESKL